MAVNPTALDELLTLSHEIGREERGLALLGEGNTSARLGEDTFLVKASGSSLGTLGKDDLVACNLSAVIALLDQGEMSDEEINAALLGARVDKSAKKPSVETVFHAFLLSLSDVMFVGHCHATTVNQILCSPRAREFADCRMFPDEIVCCGVASVFVPLTDPGLELARAIRRETAIFVRRHQQVPRVILMENHGAIALGQSWQSVLAAILMLEKAAQVFVGAALLGGPKFLSPKEVMRIAGRPDELYRQRLLETGSPHSDEQANATRKKAALRA